MQRHAMHSHVACYDAFNLPCYSPCRAYGQHTLALVSRLRSEMSAACSPMAPKGMPTPPTCRVP